jgi:DedD protein
MKHVIETRIKHRLVGLAVIILIGSIVMPAIMKTSIPSQDKALFKQVSMRPIKTKLSLSPETNEAIIVAKKDLPIPIIDGLPSIKIADFTPIEPMPVKKDIGVADTTITPKQLLAMPKKSHHKLIKETYVIQLGTFTQQSNAAFLVRTLRKKGYKAAYRKTHDKKRIIFKVFIDNAGYKKNAIILQQQLASTLKMKGLIVPTTGVS